MNMHIIMIIGIGLPFLGTVLGASIVLFFKKEMNIIIERIFYGFAAGIMIAASFWSLIIPASQIAEQQNKLIWVCLSAGILIGVCSIKGIEKIINKTQNKKLSKTSLLVLAMTIHNIPEGMAVGIALASIINTNISMKLSYVISIAIGIAIQNIPDGATVSMPLRSSGESRKKSFWLGVLSGAIEPVFAILTIIFSTFINNIMSYLLAFAAGAMLLIVIEDLIPESQKDKYSNFGTVGTIIGFILMMILDTTM